MLGPFSIKFPIVMLKIYHHRKENSYRGSRDSFGNGMTRGTTWEGVEYLVVTKVFCRIGLPARSSSPSFPGGSLLRYGPPSLLPAPTKTSPPQETVPLPAVLPSLPPLAGLTHRPARRHRGGAPVASTPLHPTPDGRLLPRYRSHA